MNPSTLPDQPFEDAIAALSNGAMSALRRDALSRFQSTGFPSTSEEDWKYTDLAPVAEVSRNWLEIGAPIDSNDAIEDGIAKIRDSMDLTWLVIANGSILGGTPAELQGTNVQIGRLEEQGIEPTSDLPLHDLNTALLNDGLSIRIPADVRLEKPLGILVIDSAASGPRVSQARLQIDVASGAHAQIVEYHASLGDGLHYSNAIVDVSLAEHAEIRYLRLQDRNYRHSQTHRMQVELADSSRLTHSGIDLGGRLIRNDLVVDIAGRRSEAHFDGVYLAGDGQHVDNHTHTNHRVGPATSNQEYRGILSGSCRCVWNGKAIVHEGADGTDARQANHNLLLSEQAEIDAKPELEIYADDVKCSHGTTVGQLDESALFYLRSRGLDRDHATRVLTRAFAATVVDKLPIPVLAERVLAMVEARLGEITTANRGNQGDQQ